MISCSPIVAPEDEEAYKSRVAATTSEQDVAAQIPNPFQGQQSNDVLPNVGGIVIGARKWIEPGKEIEKSVIVGGGKATFVETIADSAGKQLSAEQLKKLGLGDPKTVEKLKKELDNAAGGLPWKLEVFDTPQGREYRGVVMDDDEPKDGKTVEGDGEGKSRKGKERDKGSSGDEKNGDRYEEEGSEETYKTRDKDEL